MKVLSRDFTLKEKILLLILSLALIGLAYYQFIDQPVRRDLAAAQSEKEYLQIELNAVQAQLVQLKKMEQELTDLSGDNSLGIMGSYNNSKTEIALLNDILRDTQQYSISFSDVTRNGNLIRRNFSLQFTASDYEEAIQMLTRLSRSECRCRLGNVYCEAEDGNVLKGPVSVSATATFYETMVGGKEDAGLPKDQAAAAES